MVRALRVLFVALASIGLLSPGAAFGADPVPSATEKQPVASRAEAAVQDVTLDAAGCLRGLVVDVQGAPVAHAKITVRSMGRTPAQVETDGLGRFAVGPLGGGTCQLIVNGEGRLVRVWANQTAPPVAKSMVLVVLGGTIVRGQLPLEQFCGSDSFVILGMVAAAVAIPIAVHNGGGPSSPE